MDVNIGNINATIEMGYAVLTGGRCLDGHPIISFPPDSLHELQRCLTGDLLLLLRYYVAIAGPKVTIIVDMREKWTGTEIIKTIIAFDELQNDRKGNISSVYIIKPDDNSERRVLKRCLLRKNSDGRLLPFYKVRLLESLDELYNYVDKEQLTVDFGGTLQYNHLAWVDFQRSYSTLVASARTLKNKIVTIKNHTMKLRKHESKEVLPVEVSNRHKETRAQYESILEQHQVRQIVFKCKAALERLDNPDDDPDLIQVHCSLLIETKNILNDILENILPIIDEMDDSVAIFEGEMSILAKLFECRKNTEEVKETIALLMSQISESAIVGKDIREAINFRAYFTISALEPSKEIVACATSILKNLDGGSKTTQRTYNIAFEIAKELTQSIQPFTCLMNKLNEDYTKIHVFHTVLEKMINWKSKASAFIVRQLISTLTDRVINEDEEQPDILSSHKVNTTKTEFMKVKSATFQELKESCPGIDNANGASTKVEFMTGIKHTMENNKQKIVRVNSNNSTKPYASRENQPSIHEHVQPDGTGTFNIDKKEDCTKLNGQQSFQENKSVEYNTCFSIILERPFDWNMQLKRFYRKHPAPKKKHIKLLTKFEPVKCHTKLKNKAETVAERTLFVLSFLRKKSFKSEEIIRIQQWEKEDYETTLPYQRRITNNKNDNSHILEVTLV